MEHTPSPTVEAVLEAVGELLCLVAEDGAVAWAGPAWERELGLDPAAVAGRPVWELAHPDDRERMAGEIAAMRTAGGRTAGFQCRVPSSIGDTLWFDWTGVPTPDGLVLSGRDVTPLRAGDPGRDALVASALDAIVSIDERDRIVEFNPSAERIFGHLREDALGRPLAELLVPAAQRDAHRAGVRRVAGGAPFHLLGQRLEVSALHADGTAFPVELTITQSSAQPFRVTAFVRDLSAEHAARTALSESEARYAQVFDEAPVGIALVSVDPEQAGRLMKVNDALVQMLGYSAEELLGGRFADVTHPDDVAAGERLFGDLLAGRRDGYDVEKRFVRRDGSVMWGLVHGTVVRDADGRILYGIRQLQDITVSKRAEVALRGNQERLARTERLARIGAWEWDIGADRFSWSEGLTDIFGPFDADDPPSQERFLRSVHPDDRAYVHRIVDEALQGRVETTWEYRVMRGPDVIHMFAWGEVIVGADDAPMLIRGYAQDVTGRRRAEQRAARVRRDTDRILDSAGDGIFRVDAIGCATYVNPAAARMLGYTPDELLGQPIHDLIHHAHPDGTPHPWRSCPMRTTLLHGETLRVTDDVLWRRDGTPLPVEYTSAPVLDDDQVTGAVVVFVDVTERREVEERLRMFAERDALTGLVNRRRFEEVLAQRLERPGHGGGALLLLDLDHFKFVNDSFGHAAGDDLIRAIAGVLAERLRGEDVLARLGGDEFAVLLPKADAVEAAAVARRLVAGVEVARPTGLQIGASVGVACFAPDAESTAGDLLIAADIALYKAKETGRGRVELFTGQAGASLTWIERLRSALEEDRFVLHAQPIVDLATGATVQEELLIRLVDEGGAVVPPAQFLPTAESFAFVGEIDRWVVARGVAIAATGRRVHINLSGRSVGSETLLAELAEALEQTGADPTNVVFELTETAAITNMTAARDFAAHLRRLGCQLALDDFGTGFGSFTYLRDLPTDYLKIDKQFVGNLAHSSADLRVVESIVGVAAAFGQRTIAEGVEDEATLQLLRGAGVDFAQGYHLGRPAPT
ncbi:MAG TPA: PAS domain S-box protein [Capillimicrobium sp.]|jgi:diguanylate cyclase (GGDEF)-like protein/PAS domain S-box-containing protein